MYLGLYLSSDSVSWGTFYHGRFCVHTYDMPETELHDADGVFRALAFLEGRMLPDIPEEVSYCVVTMPYMSLRDRVHVERALRRLRLFAACRFRCISGVSASAMGLVDRRWTTPEREQDYSLLLFSSGREHEAAFVEIGDGVAEMIAVQQWEDGEDRELDQETLRENIGRLIDHSGARRFYRMYVSESISPELRACLRSFYGVPCETMEKNIPVYGAALTAAVSCHSANTKDLLLLDCTDYQVRVGTETLMNRSVTIPCESRSRIIYNAARPDKCVDLYFFRNAKLESPLYIKPPIHELIREERGNIPLMVTVRADHEGRLSLEVVREMDGRGLVFEWPDLRDMLMD